MKRYVVFRDTCLLVIDEGDPVPSIDEIADADRLRSALAIGDPRVQLVPSAEQPGCLEASWFTRVRVS